MAKALTALTVGDWDKLKADSGIAKTPTLKALLGGAANVGPALGSFRTAYAAWAGEVSKKAETMGTATKYFMAVAKLKDALEKFEKIKDLNTPAVKTMKDSVIAWKKEATEMAVNQAGYIKANKAKLDAGSAKGMKDVLDQTGIGG